MTVELNPRQERLLREAMQQRHLHSIDDAPDEALRSLASTAQNAPHATPRSLAEAADRIRALRKGHLLPAGVTIRALITRW
jgi:hypothetical protein